MSADFPSRGQIMNSRRRRLQPEALTISRPTDRSSSPELTEALQAYLESAVSDSIAQDAFAELVYGGRKDLALVLLLSAVLRQSNQAPPAQPAAAQSNEPPATSTEPSTPQSQENRMNTDSLINWATLRAESRQHTESLKELTTHVAGVITRLQTNTAPAPFVLPTQYLSFYERLTNPVLRSWFFKEHKELIEIALRAEEWEKIQREGDRIEQATKPQPGSLTFQYESIEDAVQRRQFYEQNKVAIHAELAERRTATLKLESEQRLSTQNGEKTSL